MKNQKDLPNTEKVLVVDDTPVNLRLLVDILTKSGYFVCAASDGQSTLQTARTEVPDLILLDVMMPDMDGYEVCRLLKADPATYQIPVIFVSALDETFDKVRGFKAGGVDYITKPFQVEEILARIETHLEVQRLQQQLETQNIRLQQEIDERKRKEERLRLLESVVINTNDAVMITEFSPIDEPGPRIVYVNQAFTEMTGYKKVEVIGQTPRILQGPKTDRSVLDKIRQALVNWEPVRAELINYTKDEQEFWVELDISPVADQNGQWTHWVAIQRDITQRKAAEVALQQSEEKYRLLAENSSDAIALIEKDKITYISPAYENICGYQASELIGVDFMITLPQIHPDDAVRILELVQRGSKEKITVQQYAFRLACKDGSYTWVEDVIKREFDEQGNHIRTIVNTRDITERKQLEEQLYQSQKMEAIGHLAGGVAHHFNNMLTTIMGYVDLSLSELSPTEALAQDLEIVKKTTQRAAELTRQLLAFTRKQIIRPKVINLNDLVLNTKSMLRQLIDESIELTTSLALDLGQVKMDAGQFEQLLVNLVINARDAMPNGGKLDIKTQNIYIGSLNGYQYAEIPPGDYVKLTVTDNGVGIAEEIKSRIFDPFFTTKEVGQGTGLGLSTCFGIVKQHNGHIMVNSQPKLGTTFEVYLPCLWEIQAVTQETPSIDKFPIGNETILIVEDESAVREVAVRALRKQGYTVLEANNGALALQMVNQQTIPQIDLLLTDVVMPEIGGQELATQLKAKYPHLKVLLVSGYADKFINPATNHNTVFLSKPFGLATLTQKVRNLLDQPHKKLAQS